MATGNDSGQNARVWQTLWESPFALKTMLIGTFVNSAGGFLRIFVVLFLRHKGYSVVWSTAALGALGAGSLLGLLVGGTLYARLGPRAVTVLSMTGCGVLTIALVYLPGNRPLLFADAVLIGLVGSVFGPVAATLLSALTPPDRQVMIFALSRFSLNLGVTAAPLIGFALIFLDHKQYTLLFWGDGITSLAYAGLALVALSARRLPARPRKATGGGKRHGGYGAVLRDRRYLVYLIAAFLGVAVYVQFQTVMPLDITAKHLNIFWYALAVFVNGLIVIGLELLVTKRSQKWAPRVAIGMSYLLIAVGVATYGLPLVPVVIIIGTVIWSLGEILGGPATFAYAAMAGPAELKSYYISSFQFVFELGAAAGSFAGGFLFAVLSHRVWPVIGAAEIVGLVLILAATRRSRPAAVPSPPQDPQDPQAASAAPAGAGEPG
jgi:predicted MFS family arabinose efflux permease